MELFTEAWNDLSPLEKADSLFEAAKQAANDGLDQIAVGYFIQSLNLYRGHNHTPGIAAALVRLGYLAGWADFGDGLDMFTRKRTLGEEAVMQYRDLGDKGGLADALCMLSAVEPNETAMEQLEEALALSEESGDKHRMARTVMSLGNRMALSQNREQATKYKEQAVTLARESGDKSLLATALFSLAIGAGEAKEAEYLEECLTLRRELGQKKRMAETLGLLARCRHYQNDPAKQEAYEWENLAVCREIGSDLWASSSLDRLAEFARGRGDEERAAALEAESHALHPAEEMDQAAQAAFEKALKSNDQEAMQNVLKRMFPARAKKQKR